MNSDRIKEIQQETAYPDSISVQYALLKVWNECEQEQVKNCNISHNIGTSLPLKIERVIPFVAKKWGKEYGGTTIGLLGQDAIELCKEYGIDWESYF